MERPQVDISTASIFRALMVVGGLVLFYLLSNVVIILLFAIVIASAVGPFVGWFEQRRVPRLVAVLMLYGLVAVLGLALSSLVLPSISTNLSQLTSSLPKLTNAISTSLDTVQQQSKYFDFVSEIQNILEVMTGYLQQFSQSAFNGIVGAVGGIFAFMAILVISFYLSIMKDGIQTFLAAVVPERYEEYVINLWRRVEIKVGHWLQAQLFLALVIGLLIYIGLSILNVKFALIFAVIAMALEIVPVAGPVLAAIPAISFAFVQEPSLGFWVLVLFVGVQQLEGNLLVPLVLGRSTGMNPIVVMLAILIGGQLAGIPGALLGVPVATIIVEILDDMARFKTSRRSA